jgi:hypothetical protein
VRSTQPLSVCAPDHRATARLMSSYCVLACLDRQASLDEDALEVMAIKEAQTRARGTVRGRGGRKAQQGAEGDPRWSPQQRCLLRWSPTARGSAKKRNRGRDGALACACSRAGLIMLFRGSVRFSGCICLALYVVRECSEWDGLSLGSVGVGRLGTPLNSTR